MERSACTIIKVDGWLHGWTDDDREKVLNWMDVCIASMHACMHT